METKNPNIIEIRNFFKVKNKTSESFFIQSFFYQIQITLI